MPLSSKKEHGKKGEEQSVKDWLPFKDIVNGIIVMKDGGYIKLFEVLPVNFKLKSKKEKRLIILNYKSFLKACRFPTQVSVQCKKADVEPHVRMIESFNKVEKNENVNHMRQGYINLVRTLGIKGAVSRRFFLVVPFVSPAGVKNIQFNDVVKQFADKAALIKEHLPKCGNKVVDTGESGNVEFTAEVLYTYLNRRTCDVQKFGGKFLTLTGVLVGIDKHSGEGCA